MSRYRDTVLGLEPVAYWRLGEPAGGVAVDELFGHHGTYSGAPVFGEPGAVDDDDTAVALEASDLVRVADAPELTLTSEWTLASWVRGTLPVGSPEQAIVGKGVGGYLLKLTGGGEPQIGVYGVANGVYAEGAAVTDGAWHLVVGTKHGTTERMYVDAVDRTTGSPLSTDPWDVPHELVLGALLPDGTGGFAGSLDEVAIWDRALSPFEVAALWDAAQSVEVPPLPPGEWVTAELTLSRSGASSTPSTDDLEFAQVCASAVNAGLDQVLEDADVTGLEPELLWLASMAGVEAYKRREAVFGITGYVDLQGAAIRVARDYLEAQRPILARYATRGIA